MPLEPKKPIEDLLEASAKARQTEFGADPKMPNPMRVRLHEEVARLGSDEKPRSSWHWFGISWPRLALAAAMTMLLIGGPIVWRARQAQPAGDSLQLAVRAPAAATEADQAADSFESLGSFRGKLAKAEPVPAAPLEQRETSAATAFADATEGGAVLAEENPQISQDDVVALKKFAEVAITPAAPTGGMTKGSMMLESKRTDDQIADRARFTSPAKEDVSKPAPQAAAPSQSLAQNRKAEANFRQQFSQVAANQAFRRNAKSRQNVNVLNNFQVEQDGSQIRVVDEDGSTYTGKIEQLSESDTRNLSKGKQSYAARSTRRETPGKDAEQTTNEFYFRAAGYNGSLRKHVEFEGNYIPTPAQQQQRAPASRTLPNTEQNSARIVGTAKIHGETPVVVDAVSVAQ